MRCIELILMNFTVISLWPVDFLFSRLVIIFATSSAFVSKRNIDWFALCPMYFKKSLSDVEWNLLDNFDPILQKKLLNISVISEGFLINLLSTFICLICDFFVLFWLIMEPKVFQRPWQDVLCASIRFFIIDYLCFLMILFSWSL